MSVYADGIGCQAVKDRGLTKGFENIISPERMSSMHEIPEATVHKISSMMQGSGRGFNP